MKKVIVAMVCITLVEVIAIKEGLSGTLLRLGIAAIAGLAGLATPTERILAKIWRRIRMREEDKRVEAAEKELAAAMKAKEEADKAAPEEADHRCDDQADAETQ